MIARYLQLPTNNKIRVRSLIELEDEVCKAAEKEERCHFLDIGGIVGARSTHVDHELSAALFAIGYTEASAMALYTSGAADLVIPYIVRETLKARDDLVVTISADGDIPLYHSFAHFKQSYTETVRMEEWSSSQVMPKNWGRDGGIPKIRGTFEGGYRNYLGFNVRKFPTVGYLFEGPPTNGFSISASIWGSPVPLFR